MRPDLVEMLRCPECRGGPSLETGRDDEAAETGGLGLTGLARPQKPEGEGQCQ